MFKVAIIGGEGSKDYTKFKEKCIYYLKNRTKEGIMIYTIGDKFVDAFAERYHITTRFFPCDFKTFGKEALKVRAEEMLKECDAVIAFKDGLKSTQMITKMAVEQGLPLRNVK